MKLDLNNLASLKGFHRFQSIFNVKISQLMKHYPIEFYGLLSLRETIQLNELFNRLKQIGWLGQKFLIYDPTLYHQSSIKSHMSSLHRRPNLQLLWRGRQSILRPALIFHHRPQWQGAPSWDSWILHSVEERRQKSKPSRWFRRRRFLEVQISKLWEKAAQRTASSPSES